MKYRYLGGSGLLVSRICLGAMTFGTKDWGCDESTSVRIVRSFFDSGGTFIDTADVYGGGVSETIVGKAVADLPRDELVIATKAWFPTGPGSLARGLSRKHLIDACDASLRRMGIDYIDLYQVHGPDPNTPVEETMAALGHLVQTGKVRYLGCSNLFGWQIVKANLVAQKLGVPGFIAAQHLYNLIRRDVEREILPACDDQGLGMICWSPLASGMLTGKYRGKDQPDAESRFGFNASIYLPRYWHEHGLNLVEEVMKVADELGTTPARVSLAWLLGDRRVSATIVGARSVEQLSDNIEAGDFDLPVQTRDRLTAAMPLEHGYPRDWMDMLMPETFKFPEFPPNHAERM